MHRRIRHSLAPIVHPVMLQNISRRSLWMVFRGNLLTINLRSIANSPTVPMAQLLNYPLSPTIPQS